MALDSVTVANEKIFKKSLTMARVAKSVVLAIFDNFFFKNKVVAAQIRLTRKPNQNVTGHLIKSASPNLILIDLFSAS